MMGMNMPMKIEMPMYHFSKPMPSQQATPSTPPRTQPDGIQAPDNGDGEVDGDKGDEVVYAVCHVSALLSAATKTRSTYTPMYAIIKYTKAEHTRGGVRPVIPGLRVVSYRLQHNGPTYCHDDEVAYVVEDLKAQRMDEEPETDPVEKVARRAHRVYP